ncbi:MAG: D-alanyl-D-alanine carboxypeptidase/D-alanyl-D-alanine-endopeptidase [Prevotella sp.]|nr:D-alanyl-D-alanine carboxypeptidase/D-alanyl-D-alanine-endopeptidase [Prevotella sp.]
MNVKRERISRYRLLAALLWLFTSAAMAQHVNGESEIVLMEDDSIAVVGNPQIEDSLSAVPSGADTLAWPQNVRARIDKLLESSIFTTSTVGLEVYDLTADSAIYRYNERQLMRPASTMKMINAVASLDKLGGSHLFKTRLCYSGKIDSGVLVGNVYCKGGFDPLFNSDDMRAFVESLRKMGVDTIRGNVYADLSMKDADLLGEGWCWDDDNPVLSPLLVGGKNQFLRRFCGELKNMGIVLRGDTLRGDTPQRVFDLCTRFHTMDQVLMRMMKKSDNLFAESIFYQLAASTGMKRANAKSGRQLVNKLITKMGFRESDYYIADGSGLSLYNYVSPELEVAFLRYAYQNENIYIHLLPAMPVAGVDGTLESRMKNGFAHQNVKAKTGTVTGVSALAGYCTAANGHLLCFSIINMGIRKAETGRSFQNKICNALCAP